MMTETRGASNEKAKRELGWRPRYAELAAGLRAGTRLSDDRGEFDALRPSAFAIAYRMLGSVSEAEDVVQQAFLRLHRARAGGEPIEPPRAYLSTVLSRLSLDHLRSARVRRETYVGEWLPEPLVASAGDDPARKAEMADSLSLAFLVLLETLSPEQPVAARAAHGRARVSRCGSRGCAPRRASAASQSGAADLLALVAIVLIARFAIFDFPDGVGREPGIFLALLAAIVVAAGVGDYRPLHGARWFPRLGND